MAPLSNMSKKINFLSFILLNCVNGFQPSNEKLTTRIEAL